MTDAQVICKGLEAYIDRPANCTYKGKAREGAIVGVKQGRCYQVEDGSGFTYENNPYGEIYIDWHERGDKQAKTFMWARVTGFSLKDGYGITARVVRPVELQELQVFRPRPMRMEE
jgi:hypothetical protein